MAKRKSNSASSLTKSLEQGQETILNVIHQAEKKIKVLQEQEKKWDDLQAKIQENVKKVKQHYFAVPYCRLKKW